MPIVEAHILEGYDTEEKARLGRALTDAVRMVVPAAPEAITVIMHELAHADYMRGGVHRTPAPALPDPLAIIRAYLDAMEARDLTTARAFLAEGCVMAFPDTPDLTTLEAVIDWSRPRYRFVHKTYDTLEALTGAQATIVYAIGTLSGEWPDGTTFAGIRFIDRFELHQGKIIRQDVWNDIAEVKAKI